MNLVHPGFLRPSPVRSASICVEQPVIDGYDPNYGRV